MLYQRIKLSNLSMVGEPGLPPELFGLAQESLADLGAALDPCPEQWQRIGYWPIIPPDPAPEGKQIASTSLQIDADAKAVVSVATYEDVPPPPAPDPLRPLSPYQFWGVVKATGYEDDLRALVASITNPVEKAFSESMLEYSLEFRRDHPLVEQMRQALGMSEGELNALWAFGHGQ